jgi:hypothetical protein
MSVARKTTVSKKEAAPAVKTKASAPTKTAAKVKISKGDSYICGVCGLAVTVDSCGHATMSGIICCGKVMKPKAAKAAKTAVKPVKASKTVKLVKPAKSIKSKK